MIIIKIKKRKKRERKGGEPEIVLFMDEIEIMRFTKIINK
jgi:hypothetical protein